MTELKDVITPLVTLAGVWLGARFTLRNELSKKALEIRTARLESIAAECSEVLTGIRNYGGTLMHVLEMDFRLLTEKVGPGLPLTSYRLSVQDLNARAAELDGSARGLDHAKMRSCRHLLMFHHPEEAVRWEATVLPMLRTLNDFLMVTMPGEPIRDMKGVSRNAAEELTLRTTLSGQLAEVARFQVELTESLSAGFIALTRPAPSLAVRCRAWCRSRFPFSSGGR